MRKLILCSTVVPLLFFSIAGHAEDHPKYAGNPRHINQNDIPWSADDGPLSEVMRWRTLLGTGGYFGEGLANEDLYVRQGEMGPGAIYPDHQHPSAEAWYFISGRAKWTVDGEEFYAEPGSAVYLKPNSVRSVEIVSKDKADIVRVNWGTDCDRTVLTDKQYIFVGNRNYPQVARSRLPVWDYTGDTTRQPVDGTSNLAPALSPTSSVHLKHINYYDVRWPGRPDTAKASPIRWKTLVGDIAAAWGAGLPNKDVLFGVGELGSAAVYDSHKHDVPEFYYIISGRVLKNIDGEEFIAEPGELIYHKPWATHRSNVVSKDSAVIMWADWGIKCDRSSLKQPYKMLGKVPSQPERAKLPR